jgi:hypothetical protein
MKTHTLFFTLLAATFAVALSGCDNNRNKEIIAAIEASKESAESVKLLNDIKQAVSLTYRNGEAFLVMTSDDVKYMADMGIVCFTNDLPPILAEWIGKHRVILNNVSTNITDPKDIEDLRKIDDEIIALKKEREDQIAKAVLYANKIAQEKIISITKQIKDYEESAAAIPAIEDSYKNIVKPFDDAVVEYEKQIEQLEKEIDTLNTESIASINSVIVNENLKVKKLEKTNFFKHVFDYHTLKTFQLEYSDLFVAGVAKKNERSQKLDEHYVLQNIEKSLQGNSSISGFIIANFNKYKNLKNTLNQIENLLEVKKSEKEKSLIPWKNRYSIKDYDSWSSDNAENRLTLSKLETELTSFQEGGDEIKKLKSVYVALQSEHFNGKLTSAKSERAELIQKSLAKIIENIYSNAAVDFWDVLGNTASKVVRTGSRGNFAVPASTKWVLAEKQRNNSEHVVWCLRVDQDKPDLILSNSNAFLLNSSTDGQWMIGFLTGKLSLNPLK